MLEIILGPFLSLVGFDYKNKRAKDRELLKRFLEDLPTNGDSISFLKDHDMGNSVPYKYFVPLNRVCEEWVAADKEFNVRSLEKLKLSFIKKLDAFLREYAKRSAGEAGGFISIGLKDYEDRKEMFEYRDKLNRFANDAYKAYDEFVRKACKEI